MIPSFSFGILHEDFKNTEQMPEPLQQVAEMIQQQFGVLPNKCIVNIYSSGGDEILPHQDQRFSDCSGRIESNESVFIIRLGATRPLVLHTIDKQETKELWLRSCDLYELTGIVNTFFRHRVVSEGVWCVFGVVIVTPPTSSLGTKRTRPARREQPQGEGSVRSPSPKKPRRRPA